MLTTTGMSAPPIGTMSRKPIANDSAVNVQNVQDACVIVKCATSSTIAASTPRLMTWRPGSRIGLPPMLPLSFRNAMTEPEKVIAPMAMPSPISTRLTVWMTANGWPIIGVTISAMPNATGLRNAAPATSTAARPTSEWNAATSCGIAVIAIRRAVTRPIAAPSPIAARISITVHGSRLSPAEALCAPTERLRPSPCVTSVVSTAIVMPIMPKRLPRRLDAGDDSPRSARMKQTPATRYASAAQGLIATCSNVPLPPFVTPASSRGPAALPRSNKRDPGSSPG